MIEELDIERSLAFLEESPLRAIRPIKQCSAYSSACAPNFPGVGCRCSSRRRGSRIQNDKVYLIGKDNISKHISIIISSL
jgi:hypothetical protein